MRRKPLMLLVFLRSFFGWCRRGVNLSLRSRQSCPLDELTLLPSLLEGQENDLLE